MIERHAFHKSQSRIFVGLAAACITVFVAFSFLPTWEKHYAYATVVHTQRGATTYGSNPTVTINWHHPPTRASAMVPIGQLKPGDRICIKYSLNRYDVPIRMMAVFDRLCTEAGVLNNHPTVADR